MSGILRLFFHDVRRLGTNIMTGIVIFGLAIIPSFFTWFNVIASWDPFSNTGNLKVAVASLDAGYTSELMPVRINVGEQVLGALRANDELDWVVTTRDEAIKGAENGEYYAAIVLPESFSQDMLTFFVAGAQPTAIEYYQNEKKNALSPKITGQGANEVTAKISETFTETISEIALALISQTSDFLSDADTQAVLNGLSAHTQNVGAQLRSLAQTVDMFTALLATSTPLVDNAYNLIDATGQSFDEASSVVKQGLTAASQLQGNLTVATGALTLALDATAAAYEAVAVAVDQVYTDAGQLNQSSVQVLADLQTQVNQQVAGYVTLRDRLANEVLPNTPVELQAGLQVVIAKLDQAIVWQQQIATALQNSNDAIADGNADLQERHEQIKAAISAAKEALAEVKTSYEKELLPQLQSLGSSLQKLKTDTAAIKSHLAATSKDLGVGAGGVQEKLGQAQAVTASLAQELRQVADEFSELYVAIAKASSSGDLSVLTEIIGADPGVLATSLAEPVGLERTAIFPIQSFGAGMTPLYIVLALWVGALLLSVTVKVNITPADYPHVSGLSLNQQFWGRYGVFALIGLVQSTILGLGLLLFVDVHAVHPWQFMFACWVTSLVFTLLIYAALVGFGNAGKALSVLLLVIQISGSGGAYPLQLLPSWFQSISPLLPATHAVAALRSAIAGSYGADYWHSIGWLFCFIIPALLVGLVLRKRLVKFNAKLVAAVEATKLM